MAANPVVWFEVLGKNGKQLQDFYRTLFDWQIKVDAAQGYGEVQSDPAGGIPGGIGQAPDGGAGHVTFYVAVSDLQGALEKVTRLGGRTIMPPTEVSPTVRIALFADPEGHVIGLFQQ